MTELLAILTQLSGLGERMIWSAVVVFLRVGSAMALLPAFGEQAVPQRVRLVLALAFTAVVAPSVSSQIPEPELGLALPLAVEVVVGLMLGIGLRLFVLALQMAGTIAAQAMSLSQLFGGTGPEPQPAVANLLVMGGLALAVMAGLHVRIAQLLIFSYEMLPPGKFPEAADLARWGVSQISRAFSLAFSLAAPFTIAALLYNIALGVINRAMPTLMVTFVGAPALTIGGLILLAVVAPPALAIWVEGLQGFLANPFPALP